MILTLLQMSPANKWAFTDIFGGLYHPIHLSFCFTNIAILSLCLLQNMSLIAFHEEKHSQWFGQIQSSYHQMKEKKNKEQFFFLIEITILGLIMIICSIYLSSEIPFRWNSSTVFCFCYWPCLKPLLSIHPLTSVGALIAIKLVIESCIETAVTSACKYFMILVCLF